MKPTPLLEASRIGWHPGGRRVLGPLDLAVPRGEHLVVIGPNGAGKTTLLRLLAGLLRPTTGAVAFAGQDLARLSRKEIARRIAYVPQLQPLSVPLTVEEVVLLGRFPHLGRFQLAPTARDLAAVAEALARVEIEGLRGRRVDELSGGERQSVYIAAALAQEAEVLVLDEPTTFLDPRHQRDIVAVLARLRDAPPGARPTVITATHDLALAGRVADRVLALQRGAVLALGAPEELLSPATLGTLFEAPFCVVTVAGRPVPLPELGAPE